MCDEPFILASQPIQVYYVPEDHDWSAAVQSKPRDVYDLDNLENEHTDNDTGSVWTLHDLRADVTVDIVNGVVPSVRTNIDGTIVDKKNLRNNKESMFCVAAIFML